MDGTQWASEGVFELKTNNWRGQKFWTNGCCEDKTQKAVEIHIDLARKMSNIQIWIVCLVLVNSLFGLDHAGFGGAAALRQVVQVDGHACVGEAGQV